MAARLFQEAKNAMQSGKAREGRWVLEFESHARRRPDPLTGWSGGADTQAQVSLNFDTLEDAKAYANKKGLTISILPAHERKIRPRNYTDNFRYYPEDEA